MLPHSGIKSFMYIAAVETCADTYTTIVNFLISLFSQQKKKAEGPIGAE